MPTPTYDLLASSVLSSSASSVTFSSIPATYRDLVLVAEMKSTSGTATVLLRVNGSSTGYNTVVMAGSGSVSSSTSASNGAETVLMWNSGPTTTTALLSVAQFLDYSATDKHKSILIRANQANGFVEALAARWANTAAINEIQAYTSPNAFASGSTFYLYGIVS